MYFCIHLDATDADVVSGGDWCVYILGWKPDILGGSLLIQISELGMQNQEWNKKHTAENRSPGSVPTQRVTPDNIVSMID